MIQPVFIKSSSAAEVDHALDVVERHIKEMKSFLISGSYNAASSTEELLTRPEKHVIMINFPMYTDNLPRSTECLRHLVNLLVSLREASQR